MTAPRSTTIEPTDPDVDLRVPAQRRQSWRAHGPIVAVVALGGAVGASIRYGASLVWPVPAGSFPWTTLWVNAVGCAVIGVFMVLITDVWAAHRLVRPFSCGETCPTRGFADAHGGGAMRRGRLRVR